MRADLVPLFTLPYPPSANTYWRHVGGRVLVSEAARTYKREAWRSALADLVTEPTEGPIAVTLLFYRPRKAGDLDNRIKVTLDALNGIAWDDDSSVVELHCYRREDKANPRVEVSVTRPASATGERSERSDVSRKARRPAGRDAHTLAGQKDKD